MTGGVVSAVCGTRRGWTTGSKAQRGEGGGEEPQLSDDEVNALQDMVHQHEAAQEELKADPTKMTAKVAFRVGDMGASLVQAGAPEDARTVVSVRTSGFSLDTSLYPGEEWKKG